MITLDHPWCLALLPLPFLVTWLLPAHRETRAALNVPFLDRLSEITGRAAAQGASVARGRIARRLLVPFVWVCLIAALCRPQWIEPPISKNLPKRDLLLAVDLSGSMDTRDFTDDKGAVTDRLTAVKQVLDGFLSNRKGDRVGLIFFGSAPFVQAPFTEDLSVCRDLLGEARTKMAGPQTAFGDAIGLAITLFDRSTMKDRVLIVLTDGNDTASQVPPAKAAEIAKDKGIVIHTVSVGDPRAAGEEALDVPTLRKVASETGGIYSGAADRKQLAEIYARLDALETREVESMSVRPRRDVFHWPLAAGFIAAMVVHGILLLPRHALSAADAPIGKEVSA